MDASLSITVTPSSTITDPCWHTFSKCNINWTDSSEGTAPSLSRKIAYFCIKCCWSLPCRSDNKVAPVLYALKFVVVWIIIEAEMLGGNREPAEGAAAHAGRRPRTRGARKRHQHVRWSVILGAKQRVQIQLYACHTAALPDCGSGRVW